MVSLPYSKRKRYLSGIDWMIHTLDHVTRKETGVGNVSQVVMEIEGDIKIEKLESSLKDFLALSPVVSGRCRRDWNLAPYWHIPQKTDLSMLKIKRFDADATRDAGAVFEILTSEVNKPFASNRQHLAFTVVSHSGTTYFAMQFDHHLLDARGAELFLSEFNAYCKTGKTSIPEEHTAPAHLDNWGDKFRSGRDANRMFRDLKDDVAPAGFPLPEQKTSRRSAFAFKSYSKEESKIISQKADEKAGYLMMLPYLLGCAVHCIHKTLSKRDNKGGSYVIPVNLDARSKEKSADELFFNHVSFLYFKFSQAEANSIGFLWEKAGRQLYDSTKAAIAKKISSATMLMRILNAGLLWRFMGSIFKGSAMSFSFSFIGSGGYDETRFLKRRLINIYHMPRVPTPPGVGIFFTICQGKLNVVFSFLEGMLKPEEAFAIMSELDVTLISGTAHD